MKPRNQRKGALARWAQWRKAVPTHKPGDLIGPAEADWRHGYVRIKAEGIGWYLVHPKARARRQAA